MARQATWAKFSCNNVRQPIVISIDSAARKLEATRLVSPVTGKFKSRLVPSRIQLPLWNRVYITPSISGTTSNRSNLIGFLQRVVCSCQCSGDAISVVLIFYRKNLVTRITKNFSSYLPLMHVLKNVSIRQTTWTVFITKNQTSVFITLNISKALARYLSNVK